MPIISFPRWGRAKDRTLAVRVRFDGFTDLVTLIEVPLVPKFELIISVQRLAERCYTTKEVIQNSALVFLLVQVTLKV